MNLNNNTISGICPSCGSHILDDIFNVDTEYPINLFKTKRNGDLAESLMEFGAIICKPKDPKMPRM